MSTSDEFSEPSQPTGGTTWRRVLFWSLLGIPLLFILLVPFNGFDPFLIPIIVIPALAGFFVRRGGRGGVIFGLVVVLLLVLANVPFFVVPALALPASTGDFISAVIFSVLAVLALIAAIATLRRGDSITLAARNAVGLGIGVVLIAVVVAAAVRVSYENARPQAGDVRLAAENIQFSTNQLDADSGTIAVFVENKDQTLHTFTIDELEVSLQIPASSKERIEFDAPAGDYNFYCIPHESDMKGTLAVR